MPDSSVHTGALGRLGRTMLRHRAAVLAAIFVVAVGVRVGATLATEGTHPEIIGDMVSYDEFAHAILAGGWWDHHVSYREPGYPLFLAAVYKLSGGSQLAARLANAILCGLNCIVIYFLGKRTFGAGVGLAAAAWFSVYFHSVHFSAFLLRESLVTLLFTLVLLLAVDAAKTRRPWSVAACAVALVGLVHTDARFLFQVPFLALYFLIACGGWRTGLATAVVFGVVFVVGMLPWQVRNYRVYDRIVLVNTRTLVVPAPWRDYSDAAPMPGLKKKVPDTREGVRRLHGLRAVLYDFTEFYRVFRFRGEVRNNSNAWEKPWSLLHNATSIAMYGTLVPFFIYGFWVILRRRMLDGAIYVLPVFAHTLLHVLKWGRDRYRMPIEPMLILVAFFGLAVLWTWWSQRRVRPVGQGGR